MFDRPHSRTWSLALAVALFAVITAMRFADHTPADAIGYLFVVPVALLGAEFRNRGAIAGAACATAVTVVWAEVTGTAVTPVGYAARSASMVLVGLLVAHLVQRSRRVSAESRRWFSMSNDLLCTSNMNGTYTAVNGAWTELLGYSREELLGRPYTDFVHADDVAATNEIASGLALPNVLVDFENRYWARDGSLHWLLWSARSDGTQIYGVAKDVTDRKRLDAEREELLERVEELAQTDELTEISNRRAWHGRMTAELSRAMRSGEPLGVAMLDLDDFKAINDTSGHQAGDRALKLCARAWASAIRETDVLGRIGGDEFALLLPDCDAAGAEDVLTRLRAATPAGTKASMGFAIWTGSESGEQLLHRADQGLYAAKAAAAAAI
ncbi:MAG: hypothetical protein QOD53_877 [Thermoleophilaceae bacterium]|jgi:diguanylate cyclase (GGDEF)-like protein/PAS domain S-box-containing protein|nr:hypothetical protein [Thermoleophilaceae bacterium]